MHAAGRSPTAHALPVARGAADAVGRSHLRRHRCHRCSTPAAPIVTHKRTQPLNAHARLTPARSAALNWAVNHCGGRRCVINMSVGGGYSAAVNLATQAAVNKGLIVAVAAGAAARVARAHAALACGHMHTTQHTLHTLQLAGCLICTGSGRRRF